MFNLHTHTKRCHHATGTDEDYVQRAIANGYELIGFSDHAPYIFPKRYKSSFRMNLSQTKNYVDSINALKNKYSSEIEIKLGFELEYYPQLFEKEIEYLKSFDYDYLILGQHFIDNEFENYSKYAASKTDSTAVFDKYVSQLLLGVETGMFTYVAHPDLINFTGDREIYLNKMEYMLNKLKESDTPIEFNFLGFIDKRHYPNDDFWKIAAEKKNRVIIGLDAHEPTMFDRTAQYNDAKLYLKNLGITPLEKIELIK